MVKDLSRDVGQTYAKSSAFSMVIGQVDTIYFKPPTTARQLVIREAEMVIAAR